MRQRDVRVAKGHFRCQHFAFYAHAAGEYIMALGIFRMHKRKGDIEIRYMRECDYDAALELWCATPGIGLNNLDDSEEGIRKFLVRNPNTSFVAIGNECLVGVILCGHDGRRGHIYHMAVAASMQNQGIGKSLLDAAVSALKRDEINKVSLVAFTHNEQGNSFWEKQGFRVRDDLKYRDKEINVPVFP